MKKVTLADLLASDRVMIPGSWAAQVMGMHPSNFIGHAKEHPERFNFQIVPSGKTHINVPRVPFLMSVTGMTAEEIEKKRPR